ncbi:MAG: hypothetical protein ABI596_11810 [Pyrinomonadaceae bacterium]
MAATLDHETFSKYLNTKFRVTYGESLALETELSQVGELQLDGQQERFSLFFLGPREPLLNQGMYTFDHDQMGGFTLFMVPMQPHANGTLYEVVFNRLRKSDD